MEKINIAELLKDCPKGMELDCTMFDNVTLFGVNDRENTIFPIRVLRKDGSSLELTKYGQYADADFAKCVIFPKGKTTWKGFVPPPQFKDGDIIFKDDFIAIISSIGEKGLIWYHCLYDAKSKHCKLKNGYGIGYINDSSEIRLATEEEKQKLFKAIKENGFQWNKETKTLEKLVEPKFKVGNIIQNNDGCKVEIAVVNEEDEYYGTTVKGIGDIAFSDQDDWELVPNKFDINTLKPFDKVLVRDSGFNPWRCAFYSHYVTDDMYPYRVCTYIEYKQCIPYKDNEHLLGTTDDSDEYYKTWQ